VEEAVKYACSAWAEEPAFTESWTFTALKNSKGLFKKATITLLNLSRLRYASNQDALEQA
jgi:hypothetical protein